MLEHGEGALLTAISASLRERASQALDLGGLQIICVPVIMERNAGGALLVDESVLRVRTQSRHARNWSSSRHG